MTDVPLREYLESRMDEREKAYFAQLHAAKESLDLAASALSEKLKQNDELRRRVEDLEKWKANVLGRQIVFGLAVLILAGIVTVALRLVGH